MSKLNTTDLQETKRKNKSELIINHAVANVELYNNKPKALSYYFDENKLFMKLEVETKKGETRSFKYFVYNEEELNEVTSVLSNMYNIPVIEETL